MGIKVCVFFFLAAVSKVHANKASRGPGSVSNYQGMSTHIKCIICFSQYDNFSIIQ